VPYDAVDMMQIVHHSGYVVWFEMARVEHARSLGIDFKDLVLNRGLATAMTEIKLNFHSPSRFDEEILVKTRIASAGNSSTKFECQILKLSANSHPSSRALLCSDFAILVLVDTKTGKPTPIPKDISKKIASNLGFD